MTLTLRSIETWFWRFFLAATAVALVILPANWSPETMAAALSSSPAFRPILLRCLAALDTGWVLLAVIVIYLHLVRQEGLAVARRVTGITLAGAALLTALSASSLMPWGPVVYTGRLGTPVWGVPLSVPLLWLVVVVSARYTVLHFLAHARRWQIALGTALLAGLTDVSLEMVGWQVRGYWDWPTRAGQAWPPAMNTVLWMLYAGACAWVAFPAARPIGRQVRPLSVFILLNGLAGMTITARIVGGG